LGEKSDKQLAEEHWKYTEGIIKLIYHGPKLNLKIFKYLYIQAMIHGIKHGREEND